MIYAFTGLPGSGKTLAMLHTMRELRHTHDLYANFHTNGRLSTFSLWNDFLLLVRRRSRRPRAYFIDEAQIWFPSREWKDTGRAELARFQQHRKNGIDLFWSAQNEARVDLAIRELTAEYWRVKRFWRIVQIKRESAVADQSGKAVKLGSTFFYASDWHFKAYWTQEIIGDRFGDGYDWGTSSLYSEPEPVLCIQTPDEVIYLPADSFVLDRIHLLKGLYPSEDLHFEHGFRIDGHYFPAVRPAKPSDVATFYNTEAAAAREAAGVARVEAVVNLPQPEKKRKWP